MNRKVTRLVRAGIYVAEVTVERIPDDGACDDSDLDVLIDIDPALPKFSLVDLASIANLLTDITGIEATPIERKMLAKDPRFAGRIANDIVEVF